MLERGILVILRSLVVVGLCWIGFMMGNIIEK